MSEAARAFVAGATGYTGRAVVEELRRLGIATWAHVRPDSSRLGEFRTRFEALGASVDTAAWDAEPIAASLARVRPSLVFALLGTTRARARTEGMAAAHAYARIDYGLTKWLLDAAVACGSAPRFVYLSAANVRASAKNAYVAARVRAERAIQAAPIPWTIARPSFISGSDRDEDRPLERVAAVIGDGALALAGALGARRARDRYRSIDAATLARGLIRIARDPDHVGRIVYAEALR